MRRSQQAAIPAHSSHDIRWRSSTVEHLICNQAVVGSIPIASFEGVSSGGDPTPSEGDIKVTRDLIRAAQMMKIDLLDHVILGDATPERPKDYSSLRELGYFYT